MVFLYKICAAQCMDLVTNWYYQQWICRTVYNNSIGECTKVIPVLRLVNRPNVIQYHFPTKRRFFVINFRLCKEQIWHCNIVFSRFVESVNMYIQWNDCFNIVGNLITCYLHRFSLSSIKQLKSLWSHLNSEVVGKWLDIIYYSLFINSPKQQQLPPPPKNNEK